MRTFLWTFLMVFASVNAQAPLFSASRQKFAMELYKIMPKNKSFLISPTSIDFAINIAFLGSSNVTYDELKSGLQYPTNYTKKMIQSNLQKWHQQLVEAGGIELATKLYINKTLNVQSNFRKTISKTLNADVEKIAFANTVKAAKNINSWIDNSTHGMIKNIVTKEMLSERLKMLIANCIYFSGQWVAQFKISNTFQNDFYGPEKNTRMSFMTKKALFRFNESIDELNGAMAVSLKYRNSNVTMLLILPPNDTQISDWYQSVQYFDWTTIDDFLGPNVVNVTIPKFSITFKDEMVDYLRKMGIQNLFDAEKSNLNKMFTSASASKGLGIFSVIHKTIIKVDEHGTIAAGVTITSLSSFRSEQENEFIANRPFMFMLRNGVDILFIGQYVG